jgi:hypothetical protein
MTDADEDVGDDTCIGDDMFSCNGDETVSVHHEGARIWLTTVVVDEGETMSFSQSSLRDERVNDFCVSFSSNSVYCVTSSGGGNDFVNEDLSKSVEVNNL